MTRLALVALLAGGVLSMSGCTIQKAVQVDVQVLDGSMVLVKPTNGLTRGGETVVKIENYSQRPVNVILAETTLPAKQLPKKLVNALSPRDDSRIVGMTSRIGKAKVTFAYGAIPQPAPQVSSLHVYLKPGKRYLLFDALGGYAHGVSLVLEPPRSK